MFLRKSLMALCLVLALTTACHHEKKEESKPSSATQTPAPGEVKSEKSAAVPAAPNLSTPVDSVKSFYDAVAKEQFDVAWASLSKASQDKFVSMVSEDEKMDAAKVRELFEQNQMSIRLGFWRSFRNSSKIDVFAPGASYKVVNAGPELTEVEMTSGTVSLKSKSINENGKWKMGYVETFLP